MEHVLACLYVPVSYLCVLCGTTNNSSMPLKNTAQLPQLPPVKMTCF